MAVPVLPFTAIRLALTIGAFLLATGCALIQPEDICTQHERKTRENRITTQYTLQPPGTNRPKTALRPLPRNLSAQVSLYKMSFDANRVQTCTDLSIRKELILQRLDKVALVFKEVREFFGPDGTLIATNTEDLTAQFQTSGHYQAVTPLPIPRSAPPGRYRIVSKFTLETHDARKPVLLARVDGSFHIASRP